MKLTNFYNYRRDGTGRGRRPDKKDGHGKGNWGDKPDVTYKKKGTDEEESKEPKKAVEEEQKVEKVKMITEIIGYSLEDVVGQQKTVAKKEVRKAEGITGTKVESNTTEKLHQSTLLQNQYQKDTLATQTDVNNVLFGFGNAKDEEEEVRGDKRAPKRGGREGGQQAQKGGRRQNPKQSLKKTEDDYPTL